MKSSCIDMSEGLLILDAKQKQQVEENLLKVSVDGRVACAAALAIAKTLDVPSWQVGKIADLLGLRISKCQLSCF